LPDYRTQHVLTGTNGTFQDHCDASGNLVEYTCATNFGCDAPEGADCAPQEYLTGAVSAGDVDCFGLCTEGRCDLPCVVDGVQLTVLHVDDATGDLILEANNGAPSWLECARPSSCASLTVGEVHAVQGASLDSGNCSAQLPALSLDDGCRYTCWYRELGLPLPPCTSIIEKTDSYTTTGCETGGVEWDLDTVACDYEEDTLVITGDVCELCSQARDALRFPVFYTDCAACEWRDVSSGYVQSGPNAVESSGSFEANECREGILRPNRSSLPDTDCFLVHAAVEIAVGAGGEGVTAGKPICRCTQDSCVSCADGTCTE
jgi:hypothetical protein